MRDELAERLQHLLVPKDANDLKDVILEIKAGEGGEESALFAGDLLRMYLRYAERHGWRTEVLDAVDSDLGGYKDVTVAVRARGGEGAWSRLKFEGGVHRVQRVPVTESQGRIHTSAGECSSSLRPRTSTSRSTRAIFASTSSAPPVPAARASTRPTRPCASRTCRRESLCPARTRRASCRTRSRRCASSRARLLAAAQEEAEREAADARKSQVRTVDCSERIRTYNFPENRISDHRVNYKSHNLDHVLDGDLDPMIQALTDADTAHRLAQAQRG